MAIFQADVARAVDFSPMTAGRVLKTLDRAGRPFTDEDAVAIFAVAELQRLGMTAAAAAELLSELSSELRFVIRSSANRSWVAFITTAKGGKSRVLCHTLHHLESAIEAFPFSSILPLHELVARAAERLKTLKAGKEAA